MAIPTYVVLFWLIAVVTSQTCQQSEAAKKLEEYIQANRPYIKPRYRQCYHVTPPVGWMNDPNGFSYFKGKFHIFYQFNPYDTAPGRMHWAHSVSSNLVDWKTLGTALLPEEEQCFSGSAIVKEDTLILMYTGRRTTDKEPFYNETQYIATSKDAVNFQKYKGNPVLSYTPNNCPDFRDPKVWKHEEYYYVIIGSKSDDKQRGRVLLYRSLDMIHWEFLRILAEAKTNGVYMWECPDLFTLCKRDVLMISPKKMVPHDDTYKNLYQTGYFLGELDHITSNFTFKTCFQELDYGHDFYASQTTIVNGTVYLVAWMNTWEKNYPEAEDGWVGTLTLFRKLDLVGDRILMKPVDEIINLREKMEHNGELCTNGTIKLKQTGELIIDFDLKQKVEILITGQNGGNKVWLRWDPVVRKVVVDRDGDERQVEWRPIGCHTWRLFLDGSSQELFCGEGEVVFSSRSYPHGGWCVTNHSLQKLYITAYGLRCSVPY